MLDNGKNKHKQTQKKHLRKYTQYKQKLQVAVSFQDPERMSERYKGILQRQGGPGYQGSDNLAKESKDRTVNEV